MTPFHGALPPARRALARARCLRSLAICFVGLVYWRGFDWLWGSSKKNALSSARARMKSAGRLEGLRERREDARDALRLLDESKGPFFTL